MSYKIKTFDASDGQVHQTVEATFKAAKQYSKTASRTLTVAEILDLSDTPINIVPAPGADKFVIPKAVYGVLDYGGTAYDTQTTLTIQYSGGTDIASFTSALAATADSAFYAPVTLDANEVENQGIEAFVPTADPQSGNSVVHVFVEYIEIELIAD